MVVLRRRRPEKDLADEVDDSITTCAQLPDDLEFGSKLLVVCSGCLLGRLAGDESKQFTKEGNSFANNVAGRKDILNMRRDG